jgi:hypothetical protein
LPATEGAVSSYHSLLLAEHGEPVFGDGGFDLYRLVDEPSAGSPVELCDPTFGGDGACWGVAFDDTPGASAAETPGVTQEFPACPGATYAIEVDTDPVGGTNLLSVSFDDPDPVRGAALGTLEAGARSRLLATAPPGSTTAKINIALGPGASIRAIQVSSYGPRCTA